MQILIDDLKRRHEYWKHEIGRAGIWKPELFLPVFIHIRKKHRRYNALFQRRITWEDSGKRITDKIIFYRNADTFDESFIDAVMVHEMIHQYIIQNAIKDSGPHGAVFKDFMQRINNSYQGRLSIRLKDSNPNVAKSGAGLTIHHILMVETERYIFFCVINPSKIKAFETQAARGIKKGIFLNYSWFLSDDLHFANFTRCTKVLHGERISPPRKNDYINQYRLKTSRNICENT